MKKSAKQFLRKMGYELKWIGSASLAGFLESRHVDTVLDVGSNIGQFAQDLRSQNYKGKIISFEPVKAVFEQLMKAVAADDAWQAYNLGLSDKSGTAPINVSENTVFSSLHSMKQAGLEFSAQTSSQKVETIQLRRLDEMDAEISGKNLFLKIDVQGHEQAVLEGASGILPRVVGLQLELPIVRLYESTWNLIEALSYMEKLGFVPCQLRPVNFHGNDPVSLIEVDAVFRRKNPDFD